MTSSPLITEVQQRVLSRLPVGYRFLPTDEELVIHYLMNKVHYRPLPPSPLEDIDARELSTKPPHRLVAPSPPYEDRERFFFIYKDITYTTTMTVGKCGFWKSGGEEFPIYGSKENILALKMQFVYFQKRSPKSVKKTQWILEEYRLSSCQMDKGCDGSQKAGWVLCRMRRGKKT